MGAYFKFQKGSDVCPICNTEDEKDAMLVGIVGTEDGSNIQAIQVHLECISEQARFIKDRDIIVIPTFTKDYDKSTD